MNSCFSKVADVQSIRSKFLHYFSFRPVQLLGLACFVIGVAVRYSIEPQSLNASQTNTVAYMLLFVGFFTLLTSILGCLAGGFENVCLLVLVRIISAW